MVSKAEQCMAYGYSQSPILKELHILLSGKLAFAAKSFCFCMADSSRSMLFKLSLFQRGCFFKVRMFDDTDLFKVRFHLKCIRKLLFLRCWHCHLSQSSGNAVFCLVDSMESGLFMHTAIVFWSMDTGKRCAFVIFAINRDIISVCEGSL